MPEFQEKCHVHAIEQVAPDVFQLSVHAPRISAAATPGQFVMVRVGEGFDPLLRRPFSIHQQFADGSLSLLFKKIGRGTTRLSRLNNGDVIDIIGPLGRGFDLSCQEPVGLVGGGMGIAPLAFLAKRLAAGEREVAKDYVLLGARDRHELAPLAAVFTALGYQVRTATDDGSMGHHGFIPDLLADIFSEIQLVYCCGPHPMMKNVVNTCAQADVLCQVSLETHMACGLGACLGCTVAGRDGNYVHVCRQGPVFYAGEVGWAE